MCKCSCVIRTWKGMTAAQLAGLSFRKIFIFDRFSHVVVHFCWSLHLSAESIFHLKFQSTQNGNIYGQKQVAAFRMSHQWASWTANEQHRSKLFECFRLLFARSLLDPSLRLPYSSTRTASLAPLSELYSSRVNTTLLWFKSMDKNNEVILQLRALTAYFGFLSEKKML